MPRCREENMQTGTHCFPEFPGKHETQLKQRKIHNSVNIGLKIKIRTVLESLR